MKNIFFSSKFSFIKHSFIDDEIDIFLLAIHIGSLVPRAGRHRGPDGSSRLRDSAAVVPIGGEVEGASDDEDHEEHDKPRTAEEPGQAVDRLPSWILQHSGLPLSSATPCSCHYAAAIRMDHGQFVADRHSCVIELYGPT